ncbi:hypothetical protein ACFW2V_12400 [Streptomyces sp. NPDC058947]|uniref:hypothetical protein n=1 Tax=Streptomyces sp. NPDC058947 TaxID=3346675 RepID=UPI0036BEA78E
MGGHLGNTISIERMGEFHEACAATSVADWVIMLDLAPESLVLYMRMCRLAEIEDTQRTRVTLTRDEANTLSGGDGGAALRDLLEVGAITKVAAYKSGKTRYAIQDLPPRTRAAAGEYRQAGGLPVATFG